MKTFSIREALKTGWEIIKNNLLFVIGTSFVYMIFNTNLGYRNWVEEGGDLSGGLDPMVLIPAIAIAIVFAVIQTIVQIGYYRIYLKLIDAGEKSKFSELFTNFHPFFRYIGTTLLYCVRVFLGFILLIVPGIIWAIKFQFMPLLTIDKGLKPLEAMKESARMTEGHKWHLFKFGIVVMVVNILGFLCFVVGILITAPLTTLAYLHIYRKLSQGGA